MKKIGVIVLSVFLVFVLSLVAYFYIWGGTPRIENFKEVSGDYETVAKIALNYYDEKSPDEEYIIIYFNNGDLEYGSEFLSLTEAQKESVRKAESRFGYLRVCKDAAFFCVDETGYYGLVYSKNPLHAIYKKGLVGSGRDYHRINSRWYEWGAFGI